MTMTEKYQGSLLATLTYTLFVLILFLLVFIISMTILCGELKEMNGSLDHISSISYKLGHLTEVMEK